jgi:hypothetical protein
MYVKSSPPLIKSMTCVYEEEDTCMSYEEEEDTCLPKVHDLCI